jgi:hypothetical protein
MRAAPSQEHFDAVSLPRAVNLPLHTANIRRWRDGHATAGEALRMPWRAGVARQSIVRVSPGGAADRPSATPGTPAARIRSGAVSGCLPRRSAWCGDQCPSRQRRLPGCRGTGAPGSGCQWCPVAAERRDGARLASDAGGARGGLDPASAPINGSPHHRMIRHENEVQRDPPPP